MLWEINICCLLFIFFKLFHYLNDVFYVFCFCIFSYEFKVHCIHCIWHAIVRAYTINLMCLNFVIWSKKTSWNTLNSIKHLQVFQKSFEMCLSNHLSLVAYLGHVQWKLFNELLSFLGFFHHWDMEKCDMSVSSLHLVNNVSQLVLSFILFYQCDH